MSHHKQVADELLSLKLELKEVKATNAALHSNLNSKDALIERLESDTEIKRQGNAQLAQEVADKQAEICDLTATNAALEDALSHAKCNFGNCDGIKHYGGLGGAEIIEHCLFNGAVEALNSTY
jgi:chromosome segregation ATPase